MFLHSYNFLCANTFFGPRPPQLVSMWPRGFAFVCVYISLSFYLGRTLDKGWGGGGAHQSSSVMVSIYGCERRRLKSQIESQISNLYFNTVKNSSGFLLHIKYNYITIFNNKKYVPKESLKNTTQNYTKLHLFSMICRVSNLIN